MKQYRVMLVLLLIASLLPAAVAADAPPFLPTLAPAVRGQDPQNPHPATTDIPPLAADYTLAATVGDVGANGVIHVSGTEQVRLTNSSTQPISAITFNVAAAHYGWFTLDGGTIDGVSTAVDQAEVRFSFPEWPTLAPGDARTVGFSFHLDIGDGGDGFDATRRDGDILRLGYWLPMLSDDHGYHDQFDAVYTATGNFHVTLTAPASQALVSTGIIQHQETSAARTTYTIDAPKVRDFTALLSSSYHMIQGTTKENVRVEVYTVPSHLMNGSLIDADLLADAVHAIEWMSMTVGPYPYPVFHVADAGLTMPGGVEFPTLVMIGTRAQGVPMQTLIAHETAHQWFYGLLGTHPQTETWVDEGAATFFEDAINAGIDVPVTLTRPLACPVNITVWDHSVSDRNHYYCVYNGGAIVYATIRGAMGSERFIAALHDLYMQDRYGIITGRDLLTVFQQHSATDLRPLLHDYLTYDWLDTLPPPGG